MELGHNIDNKGETNLYHIHKGHKDSLVSDMEYTLAAQLADSLNVGSGSGSGSSGSSVLDNTSQGILADALARAKIRKEEALDEVVKSADNQSP